MLHQQNHKGDQELNRWLNGEQTDNDSRSGSTRARGYKITDVAFSRNETCPTFMIANINPRFDISYNLSRIEDIVQTAHEENADILAQVLGAPCGARARLSKKVMVLLQDDM